MRFKDDSLEGQMRHDWDEVGSSKPSNRESYKLCSRVEVISDTCFYSFGYELMGTDFLREPNPDKPSYHEKGQAIDLRTWDMTPECFSLVSSLLTLFSRRDPQFQFEFEPMLVKDGKIIRGEHFHVEIDDNSLGGQDESSDDVA